MSLVDSLNYETVVVRPVAPPGNQGLNEARAYHNSDSYFCHPLGPQVGIRTEWGPRSQNTTGIFSLTGISYSEKLTSI